MRNLASFGTVIVALTVILAGCGDSDSDDSGDKATGTTSPALTGSPQPADRATYFFDIVELGLAPNAYVGLRNFAGQPGTLGGLFLCQPPKCFHLPDVEVAAGDMAIVARGEALDLEGIVAVWPDLSLPPADGELALYASDDVEDPKEMRDYVQWGSTPHDNTAIAVEAGLWQEAGFLSSSENATRIFRDEVGSWQFEE